MEIREIEKFELHIVEDVVDIHLKTFKGFFLTFMGKGFLKQMYESYILHEKSEVLIAIENEKIMGFLAYSKDYSGLYKYMIRQRLLPFAWYSICAFLRKPKVFFRILRAFLKPAEAKEKEKYIEIASIGVLPECKGQGIGSRLIEGVKNIFDNKKYKYIKLETDAIDNDAVNEFYKKNGFVKKREYLTHEGRKMNEYFFEGNELCSRK